MIVYKSLIAAALGAAMLPMAAAAQPAPPIPGAGQTMPPMPPTFEPTPPGPTQPTPEGAAGPLGSSWLDVTQMPDFFTGSWQSVTSFLDTRSPAPLTPEAQAHVDQYVPIEDIPFAGPGCRTPGMPIVQRLGSPLKFMFEPGMIAIYIENSSMTRFIRLNAEQPEFTNPTFLGNSVGHFEGDTLVVDSIGFDNVLLQYTTMPGQGTGGFILPPEVVFGPHGPNLRLVERIRLINPDTLEIQLTVYDETVWTEPYVSRPVQFFIRNKGENGWPNEWVCSSVPDPLDYDPITNEQVMDDPEEVLRRIIEQEGGQ